MKSSGKLLIAGSTGYLGSSLYEFFSSKYTTLGSSRAPNSQVRCIHLNELECGPLDPSIEVVIYAIGSTEMENHSYSRSVNSTLNTLSCFLDKHRHEIPKAKIIYFSTFQIYGKHKGLINESSPAKPNNVYSLVHFMAERLVEHYCDNNNLEYCIIRPSNVYGSHNGLFPFRRISLVPNCFIKEAVENLRITVKAERRVYRDFININDVVSIVDILITDILNRQNIPTVVNACSGRTKDIIEIALMVSEIVEKSIDMGIIVNTPNFKSNSESTNKKSPDLVVESHFLKGLPWKATNSMNMSREIRELVKLYKDQSSK